MKARRTLRLLLLSAILVAAAALLTQGLWVAPLVRSIAREEAARQGYELSFGSVRGLLGGAIEIRDVRLRAVQARDALRELSAGRLVVSASAWGLWRRGEAAVTGLEGSDVRLSLDLQRVADSPPGPLGLPDLDAHRLDGTVRLENGALLELRAAEGSLRGERLALSAEVFGGHGSAELPLDVPGVVLEQLDLVNVQLAEIWQLVDPDEPRPPEARLSVAGRLDVPVDVADLHELLRRGAAELRIGAEELPPALPFAPPPPLAGVAPQSLALQLVLGEGLLSITDARLQTSGGELRLESGRIELPPGGWPASRWDLSGALDVGDLALVGAWLAPHLGDLAPAGAAWNGRIAGRARVQAAAGELSVEVDVAGRDVLVAGWPLGQIALRARGDERRLRVDELSADGAAGDVRLACELLPLERRLAWLAATGALHDAARLPVPDLQGELAFILEAEGPFEDPSAEMQLLGSELVLRGRSLRFLSLLGRLQGGVFTVESVDLLAEGAELHASGRMALADGLPRRIELDALRVARGEVALGLLAPASVELGEDGIATSTVLSLAGPARALRVQALGRDAQGRQRARVVAEGLDPLGLARLLELPLADAALPPALDLDVEGAFGREDFAAAGTLGGNVPGQAPGELRPTGRLEARFALHGPWERPAGRLSLASDDLHLHGAPPGDARVGPLRLRAELELAEALTVRELSLRAPQGLTLLGGGVVGDGRAPPWSAEAPLELSLQLQDAELAPLVALFGELRRVDGELRGSVAVRGTLADPQATGELRLDEGELRLAAEFPPLDALTARVQIEPRRLTLREARGELGGAPFALSGAVAFGDGEPRLELALQGQDVLVWRDGSVKVRADVDVGVRGALDALRATGDVVLRGSRLVERVNLMHLVQGGVAGGGRELHLFSFEDGPLAAMRLDLDVRSAEPFVIESNVVKSALRPELRLTGTGRVPLLVGAIHIDPSRVLLPAGTIRVDGGRVLFEEDRPFLPRLQIEGHTRMRGYEISVFVTGDWDQPIVDLSSVPPLSGEELMLLVVTGQAPAGLGAGASGAAAQTFAVYVGQDLFARWLGDDPRGEQLLDRLEFEVASDLTASGADTYLVSYRLTELGDPTLPGSTTYLRAENDAWDHINFGLQLLFRTQ